MKEHTKNLLSIFCPLGLLLLAGLLFLGNNRPFPILSGMIEKAREEQISYERKIRQLEEGIAEKQEELNELHEIRKRAIPPHYSDVVGTFRSRVEQVFYASGAQVKTISTPRQLKGLPGIDLYEINLTAEIQIAELVSVMESLNKSPTFLWRSLYLRPNNVINPDYININAVLGAVCFKDGDNQSAGQKP